VRASKKRECRALLGRLADPDTSDGESLRQIILKSLAALILFILLVGGLPAAVFVGWMLQGLYRTPVADAWSSYAFAATVAFFVISAGLMVSILVAERTARQWAVFLALSLGLVCFLVYARATVIDEKRMLEEQRR
jgi:hypothetical protein